MTHAAITIDQDRRPTAFTGPDGVDFFRIRCLRSAMNLAAKTGGRMQVTRTMSNAQGLKMTTQYTGTKFKRGQYAEAVVALDKLLAERTAKLYAEGKIETLVPAGQEGGAA